MLESLHMENLAVIERTDVEFGPGLNVLTGETGAGKSIVIDAIGAVMGGRVGREIVRSGCPAALVSAVVSAPAEAEEWLRENDIDPEDELIIQRRVGEDGKSSCRVNGVPVSVAQLRSLGEILFDIHGQNDGAGLLRESSHLKYLDGFGGLEADRQAVAALWESWKKATDELEALREAELDKERREQALRDKIEELERIDPKPGEREALGERRALLRNSDKLASRLEEVYSDLYGDDDSEGAVSLLDEAAASLAAAARMADSVSEAAKTAESLRYAMRDLTDQVAAIRDSLDFSPGELDRIEDRLSALDRVERKYGAIDDLAAELTAARNELEDVEYLTERVAKAEKAEREAKEALDKAAAKLTEKRRASAEKLRGRIVAELSALSMPGVRFETEILPKEPDRTGADTVRFLMSANAGEDCGRISKIASGGELSRIMLAMKTVLAARSDSQTLIFDEIDTGVSGIAARRVAEKLAGLSRGRQVLCVTHLPQIAAMADRQFAVEKHEAGGRTFASAAELDERGRELELARLTSGDVVGESTLRSAAEQLESARAFKRSLDT
jgi:DNA repair protein RecN (Recombination protein N)